MLRIKIFYFELASSFEDFEPKFKLNLELKLIFKYYVGHLTLQPIEYIILEDFYRMLSKVCGETHPHRFQAVLWAVRAGNWNWDVVCFDMFDT